MPRNFLYEHAPDHLLRLLGIYGTPYVTVSGSGFYGTYAEELEQIAGNFWL